MNARPYLRILLISLAPAFLCGCLEVEEQITINPEGVIIAKLKYSAPDSTVKQLQSVVDLAGTLHNLAAQTNSPAEESQSSKLGPELFDFEYVKQHLESRKSSGVRIFGLEYDDKQSWNVIEMKGRFENLGDLRQLDHFAGQNISLTKLENGNYELLIRLTEEGDYEIPTLQTGTDDYRTVMSIFSGFRILIKVRVPGRIVSASTFRKTDHSATWSFDIRRNPNALRELHEPLRIEFTGDDLNLQEFPAEPGS